MIIKLAAGTVRRRLGAFAGTFLTAFLAVALIAGSGLLLFSVLTAGPGADRFAAADAVVAGDRAVVLTTEQAKGDGEVKIKTKSERLTGAPALPAELVGTVAGTPGVATAVPDSAFPVALDVGGVPVQAPDRAAVVAHGWASAALTPYELTQGAPPGPGGVVLDAALADGLRIGETVRLTSRTGVRDLRLVGVGCAGHGRGCAGTGRRSSSPTSRSASCPGWPGRPRSVCGWRRARTPRQWSPALQQRVGDGRCGPHRRRQGHGRSAGCGAGLHRRDLDLRLRAGDHRVRGGVRAHRDGVARGPPAACASWPCSAQRGRPRASCAACWAWRSRS